MIEIDKYLEEQVIEEEYEREKLEELERVGGEGNRNAKNIGN